jgi:hypothetical protein
VTLDLTLVITVDAGEARRELLAVEHATERLELATSRLLWFQNHTDRPEPAAHTVADDILRDIVRRRNRR